MRILKVLEGELLFIKHVSGNIYSICGWIKAFITFVLLLQPKNT